MVGIGTVSKSLKQPFDVIENTTSNMKTNNEMSLIKGAACDIKNSAKFVKWTIEEEIALRDCVLFQTKFNKIINWKIVIELMPEEYQFRTPKKLRNKWRKILSQKEFISTSLLKKLYKGKINLSIILRNRKGKNPFKQKTAEQCSDFDCSSAGNSSLGPKNKKRKKYCHCIESFDNCPEECFLASIKCRGKRPKPEIVSRWAKKLIDGKNGKKCCQDKVCGECESSNSESSSEGVMDESGTSNVKPKEVRAETIQSQLCEFRYNNELTSKWLKKLKSKFKKAKYRTPRNMEDLYKFQKEQREEKEELEKNIKVADSNEKQLDTGRQNNETKKSKTTNTISVKDNSLIKTESSKTNIKNQNYGNSKQNDIIDNSQKENMSKLNTENGAIKQTQQETIRKIVRLKKAPLPAMSAPTITNERGLKIQPPEVRGNRLSDSEKFNAYTTILFPVNYCSKLAATKNPHAVNNGRGRMNSFGGYTRDSTMRDEPLMVKREEKRKMSNVHPLNSAFNGCRDCQALYRGEPLSEYDAGYNYVRGNPSLNSYQQRFRERFDDRNPNYSRSTHNAQDLTYAQSKIGAGWQRQPPANSDDQNPHFSFVPNSSPFPESSLKPRHNSALQSQVREQEKKDQGHAKPNASQVLDTKKEQKSPNPILKGKNVKMPSLDSAENSFSGEQKPLFPTFAQRSAESSKPQNYHNAKFIPSARQNVYLSPASFYTREEFRNYVLKLNQQPPVAYASPLGSGYSIVKNPNQNNITQVSNYSFKGAIAHPNRKAIKTTLPMPGQSAEMKLPSQENRGTSKRPEGSHSESERMVDAPYERDFQERKCAVPDYRNGGFSCYECCGEELCKEALQSRFQKQSAGRRTGHGRGGYAGVRGRGRDSGAAASALIIPNYSRLFSPFRFPELNSKKIPIVERWKMHGYEHFSTVQLGTLFCSYKRNLSINRSKLTESAEDIRKQKEEISNLTKSLVSLKKDLEQESNILAEREKSGEKLLWELQSAQLEFNFCSRQFK